MRTCSVRETRESLSDLLDHVEKGEEIEITRHGKAVAVMISPAALAALRGEGERGFREAYGKFVRSADLVQGGLGRDVFTSVRVRS
jgi:prevent-host-death family protein